MFNKLHCLHGAEKLCDFTRGKQVNSPLSVYSLKIKSKYSHFVHSVPHHSTQSCHLYKYDTNACFHKSGELVYITNSSPVHCKGSRKVLRTQKGNFFSEKHLLGKNREKKNPQRLLIKLCKSAKSIVLQTLSRHDILDTTNNN